MSKVILDRKAAVASELHLDRGAMLADVAQMSANAASAQQIRGAIVEQIQPPTAKKAELNSRFRKKIRYGKIKLRTDRSEASIDPPRKRGAPAGNRNAFKHGRHTRERRAFLGEIRAHIRHGNLLIAMAGLDPGRDTEPHFGETERTSEPKGRTRSPRPGRL
jgi:hypothetical protein